MAPDVSLTCAHCRKEFLLKAKEFNRQTRNGRKEFFCSLSCGARYHNEGRKAPAIMQKCPNCGAEFETIKGKRFMTFCSRSCASKGSVTELRRTNNGKGGRNCQAQKSPEEKLQCVTRMMKKREATKYAAVHSVLTSLGIKHEFEYNPTGSAFIYDLCLPDKHIIIEFDGPEHSYMYKASTDDLKDAYATSIGFSMVRRQVAPGSQIPISILSGIL